MGNAPPAEEPGAAPLSERLTGVGARTVGPAARLLNRMTEGVFEENGSKPEEAAAALKRAPSVVRLTTPQQRETVRTLEDAIARARKARG